VALTSATKPVDASSLTWPSATRRCTAPRYGSFRAIDTRSPALRPTQAEQRLADPQILAMMRDLERIPKEELPPRIVERMAEAKTPPPALTMMLGVILEVGATGDAGVPVVMGTDAGNIGTLHGPSVFAKWP